MYQFLCIEANMPPPYLEVLSSRTMPGETEEEDQEMDEMFDDEQDWEENTGDDLDEDGHPMERDSEAMGEATVFTMDTGSYNERNSNLQSKHGKPNNRANGILPPRGHGNNKRSSNNRHDDENAMRDEDDDAKDIQSLSLIEAEFIYDKKDDSEVMTTETASKRTINLEAFKIIKVIGKGSFGKVFLVRDKASGVLYAMKVLKKDYIIRKNQVEHTKTERSVLGYIHHPNIVGLNMAFQTSDKLFFILDYCSGGELFYHLGQVGRFMEERAKFYAAQIVCALEYVHKLGVIYRDLKPENVLLDQYGNVKLTDFGLSKEGVSDHSTGANSFCGTPEYIAPEVLLRQGHGRAVDWWSLGALLYEMITGLPPFYSRNRETMFEKIMKADLSFPPTVSEVCMILFFLIFFFLLL